MRTGRSVTGRNGAAGRSSALPGVAVGAAAIFLLWLFLREESGPVAGTVSVIGDSITVQALLTDPDFARDRPDLEVHFGVGWEARHGLLPARDEAKDRRPEILVLALGVNDAAPRNGGWDGDDVAVWTDLLATPHEDACVAVVLPALGAGAPADHVAEAEQARGDIVELVEQREGPTVVRDWADVIEADPDVLGPDGVHLASDDGGQSATVASAEARLGQYRDVIEACRDLLRRAG